MDGSGNPRRSSARPGVVVEFAGMSCTGKSYLISLVESRLNALGHTTTTRTSPYSPGLLARVRSRVRALGWALRLGSDWRRPRFWLVHRILNRGFLMRGTGDANVTLISEGLFHRVYFSIRDRAGPSPLLEELAEALIDGAATKPDILVHVTARPEVIVERRLTRDASRSAQTTDRADVESAVADAMDLVEPAFRSFGARHGFEVIRVDNSGCDVADAVDTIVSRVVARV